MCTQVEIVKEMKDAADNLATPHTNHPPAATAPAPTTTASAAAAPAAAPSPSAHLHSLQGSLEARLETCAAATTTETFGSD